MLQILQSFEYGRLLTQPMTRGEQRHRVRKAVC